MATKDDRDNDRISQLEGKLSQLLDVNEGLRAELALLRGPRNVQVQDEHDPHKPTPGQHAYITQCNVAVPHPRHASSLASPGHDEYKFMGDRSLNVPPGQRIWLDDEQARALLAQGAIQRAN